MSFIVSDILSNVDELSQMLDELSKVLGQVVTLDKLSGLAFSSPLLIMNGLFDTAHSSPCCAVQA